MALPTNRLPDPKAVLAEFHLTPRGGTTLGAPTPGAGPQYRILRTLEVDAYDRPVEAADILPLGGPRPAPTNNSFTGRSRKAAKLSICNAPVEAFNDVQGLIATFPDHQTMATHTGISTDQTNDRVTEENRNVKVNAFLYAASLENDNDFHLIIGRDPAASEMYMTVEISGLPPATSPHFNQLNAARDAYFAFFGDGLPGTSYDFYDPPIPVEVEGSLFFDFSHATGSRPGPSRLRPNMPVVWEIHPISNIVFEP